ncbi:hypothetical protein B0H16DRAFT_1456170 [Mycena metata]|uniref:Uncharacterized protein n=1 Tax=Mycena metata TaxID=1033252 RepID=A0AAD7JFJ1_9AGAR|nr:hypothetical protein B0H16DRAFT_1456170 [Mycena metata]
MAKGQRSSGRKQDKESDRAATKAKRRVSDAPRRAKLAASKLAAAEVAASEVLTKMLELKQAEPSQPDEGEEQFSEWEPPGPEVFALWRANLAKDKAELHGSGEWSESEEECGTVSRQQTPSCSEIDGVQEMGNEPVEPDRAASSSGRRSIRLPTPSFNSPSPEPRGWLPSFYDMLWEAVKH